MIFKRFMKELNSDYQSNKILHMRFISIITGLAIVLGTLQLKAQESKIWTLEECINYALDHNINIKKQYLNEQYQEELLTQSKLGILPNLNGFASHGYNWGQRVDPFTNEFATDRVRSNNLYLSGDLNLFSGFQQLNLIKRNKLDLMKAQYDADYYKDDIAISVATEYLQTLFYMEYVEIARNQLEITNQQVNRTNKLVEAGTLAKGDLLIIEAQQASEELSLVQAENNLTLSILNLTQLLELPTTEGFEIEVPELGLVDQPEILKPQQIFETAMGSRPEIKSAEINVESSEASLNIARGAYYPRLSLNGSIGSGYSGANVIGKDPTYFLPQIAVTENGQAVYPLSEQVSYGGFDPKPFSDQFSDNLNETVGLNLSIPIFNGWSARSQVAQAKIGIENANLDLELQKNTLYKVIQQAYNDAVSAYNSYKASDKKVLATSESFKYAEQKYNVGLINSVEYNDAKKEYNNALSEKIQAKFDFVFRTTVIDFYMGKPLSLDR
jgi:outer membrane protein